MNDRVRFVVCEKCGKKLIVRKENGLWYFAFGRHKDEEGNITGVAPVEMYIYGSIKMKCIKRECDHWNILNHFPFEFLRFQEDST
jgi:hypothetical protein